MLRRRWRSRALLRRSLVLRVTAAGEQQGENDAEDTDPDHAGQHKPEPRRITIERSVNGADLLAPAPCLRDPFVGKPPIAYCGLPSRGEREELEVKKSRFA